MSLGWGLRGYIGGGPLGAMIPGAMVMLALCFLLKRQGHDNGVAAAFGALGIGFGGQMTYGQTIGLTLQPDTAAWGLLGLTLKGAIWGLLGGAVVGTGLQSSLGPRRLRLASLALIAGCMIGWKFINEPKLIYFSNRLDRPRAEIWAGLLLAALAFLFVIRSRVSWDFAWIGAIGGGVGFGLGGCINALGRTSGMPSLIDWWKVMEFTFGMLFGAALGYGAWRYREELSEDPEEQTSSNFWLLLLPLILMGIAAEERSGFRFAYTFVGALLLPLVAENARFGWQVAITMTVTAFAVDFAQSRPAWSEQTFLWLGVVAISMATTWIVDRNRRVDRMLLFLMWLAVVDSYLKAWLPPFEWTSQAFAHAHVEIAFTVLAIAATWMMGNRKSFAS